MLDQHIDRITIVGLAALIVPLLVMWHEIGGHAAACTILGGHVTTIGAFYVDCLVAQGLPRIIVACAGVAVNILLSLVAWRLWRVATSDRARLILWLVWVSEAMVGAGYFCFSGVSGFGDLGTGAGGALIGLPQPVLMRVAELAVGIAAYVWIVRVAIRSLTQMLGDASATRNARRTIAHGFYLAAGAVSVLVGLLNPIGFLITVMSAAASSFGGLAGMISVGFATPKGERIVPFTVPRSWPIVAAGVAIALAFATVFGPSRHF